MIGIIITLILIVIAFFIGRAFSKPVSWKEKKAELERDFVEERSDLEKQVLEKERDQEKEIKELSIAHADQVTQLKDKFLELIKGHRKDAISRSRNTLMGKLWETMAPYLPKFKHHPADMRFLGSPIDYIIFEGMNEKKINKVIFLEVKSGDSKLNAQEKRLKEAIQNKRVKWEEFRIDKITDMPEVDDDILEKDLKEELDIE